MRSPTSLFFTLERLLNRFEFDVNTLPTDIDMWREFIERVNNVFHDFEQERYLLERSIEISSREMVELNEHLVSLSRQAGMSEVATSVLHNIGNVLNSVNISILLIQEIIKNSEIKNLDKIKTLLNENTQTQPDYLFTDLKGKLIPKYISVLSDNMANEHDRLSNEIIYLIKNIGHIKDIVSMQNDISGISAMKEKVVLSELCDLAIQMSCPNPEKFGIKLVKEYECSASVMVDKTKLLQIMVNLLSNAKDALTASMQKDKRMVLSIRKSDTPHQIEMSVEDNGVGISKVNLKNIFSMGFTTKKEGHGFGLHSSAIAAADMHGSLVGYSEGEGKGAKFTLLLPWMIE